MQYRPDVELDGGVQAASVGEDLDLHTGTRIRVGDCKPVHLRRTRRWLHPQARGEQGGPQRGRDAHSFVEIAVGEQVDVLRRPVHEAVGEHRPAAGQGDGTGFRQPGRDLQDPSRQRFRGIPATRPLGQR